MILGVSCTGLGVGLHDPDAPLPTQLFYDSRILRSCSRSHKTPETVFRWEIYAGAVG